MSKKRKHKKVQNQVKEDREDDTEYTWQPSVNMASVLEIQVV